jgi:hypothetical protein
MLTVNGILWPTFFLKKSFIRVPRALFISEAVACPPGLGKKVDLKLSVSRDQCYVVKFCAKKWRFYSEFYEKMIITLSFKKNAIFQKL